MVITWVRNPPPVLTRAGDNKCHNAIKACDEEDIWYDVPVGHFDTRRSPNFEELVNNNNNGVLVVTVEYHSRRL